jgi:hypothetical protein
VQLSSTRQKSEFVTVNPDWKYYIKTSQILRFTFQPKLRRWLVSSEGDFKLLTPKLARKMLNEALDAGLGVSASQPENGHYLLFNFN